MNCSTDNLFEVVADPAAERVGCKKHRFSAVFSGIFFFSFYRIGFTTDKGSLGGT